MRCEYRRAYAHHGHEDNDVEDNICHREHVKIRGVEIGGHPRHKRDRRLGEERYREYNRQPSSTKFIQINVFGISPNQTKEYVKNSIQCDIKNMSVICFVEISGHPRY